MQLLFFNAYLMTAYCIQGTVVLEDKINFFSVLSALREMRIYIYIYVYIHIYIFIYIKCICVVCVFVYFYLCCTHICTCIYVVI